MPDKHSTARDEHLPMTEAEALDETNFLVDRAGWLVPMKFSRWFVKTPRHRRTVRLIAGLLLTGTLGLTVFVRGDAHLPVELHLPGADPRGMDGDPAPPAEEIPSVWDELGENHGLGSGLVPYINQPAAGTTDDDGVADDAETEEETADGQPAEGGNESDAEASAAGEAGAGDAAADETETGGGTTDETDDDDGDQSGAVATVDDRCSGITHLSPGEIQSFASGVWVWTAAGAGRWVWTAQEPDHHCFDDDAAETSPSDGSTPGSVDLHAFVADYGAARSVSHVDWLLEMTHPAIRGLFDDAACRAVLAHSPAAVLATEVAEVGAIDEWLFEYGAGTVSFPAAISGSVAHYFHDGGEATFPWTAPVEDGQPFLAFDCDHPLP